MKIALLSDVHDRTENMLLALHAAKEAGCTRLFFMGDIVEISTLKLLLEEWQMPADIVFGNNEYDRAAHQRIASLFSDAVHHGDEAALEIEHRNIYFTHLPYRASAKAESGNYHAVFFGHTHVAEKFIHIGTLVVNPGEVGGVRRPPGFAVYDTATNDVSFYRI
ncbi:MAG: metallophosphoesterase family protein [Akkermansia sp.]|nr:metallophosphoesterase family protein [Akkermansia sp.]